MSPFLRAMHVRTFKAFTIDRAPTRPIMPREVATLQHELIRQFVGQSVPIELEVEKVGATTE